MMDEVASHSPGETEKKSVFLVLWKALLASTQEIRTDGKAPTVGVGRAGLEQCKSGSESNVQGALGASSVCSHHARECSVDSQHRNDKGEQSFLPRHRVIKPRALMLQKEGRKLLLQRPLWPWVTNW